VATLFIADVNLVLHVVILVMLFVGLGLKFKKKMFLHGTTMLIALVLHVVSFGLMMLPSFVSLRILFPYRNNIFSLIMLVHVILGVLTLILAAWLIVRWHLQRSIKSCTRRKKVMLLVFAIWIITLLLGILVYLSLYTTLVPWVYSEA